MDGLLNYFKKKEVPKPLNKMIQNKTHISFILKH